MILSNERSYLQRRKRGYLCLPEASEDPDIDGIVEYISHTRADATNKGIPNELAIPEIDETLLFRGISACGNSGDNWPELGAGWARRLGTY